MNFVQTLVAFLGRAFLSIIFISSGIHKILDWQASELYFYQGLTDWLALSIGNSMLQTAIEFGMAHASLLLVLGVAFEVLGGLLIFLGLWVRLGAMLLVLFLIPTSLIFHHFWQMQMGPDRDIQMINFMKNLSIFGGILTLLAWGKGIKKEKSYAAEG